MKISVEILKNLNACEDGVVRFESLYQSQEVSVVQVISNNALTWADVGLLVLIFLLLGMLLVRLD